MLSSPNDSAQEDSGSSAKRPRDSLCRGVHLFFLRFARSRRGVGEPGSRPGLSLASAVAIAGLICNCVRICVPTRPILGAFSRWHGQRQRPDSDRLRQFGRKPVSGTGQLFRHDHGDDHLLIAGVDSDLSTVMNS